MSKRRAEVELNQDNWDDDIPVVESGGFQKAEKSSLAGRKILSVTGNRTPKTGTSGLFKSFTGFSNTTVSPNITFNFGSKSSNDTSSSLKPPMMTSSSGASNDSQMNQEAEYLKQLLTLNHNLYDWIGKHIKEDPYCILSPVFSDYEKHLNILHEKFPEHSPQTVAKGQEENSSTKSSNSDTNGSRVNDKAPCAPTVGATSSCPSTVTAASTNDSQASLIQKPSTAGDTQTKPFTFTLPPITGTSAMPMFKFGTTIPSASPFALPTQVPSSEQSSTNVDDENEEYQPPKPEVKEIKEEGSVFTIRCKLFYKVDTEWRERGVGNLYIKPTTTDKFQLLVRADTNLGNILLNILVTRDIPFKQQKNNLTFVCVPSPPLPAMSKQQQQGASGTGESLKPVPMLIRLKSEDNATELLNKFDQYRGVSNKSDS